MLSKSELCRTGMVIGCVLSVALFCGCEKTEPTGPESEAGNTGVPVVYTVNYPLHYFAARIAGDHARVVFPAPGDVDPAFWEPSSEVVQAFQEADLILLNGADYAKWTRRASLAYSRIVVTSAAFRDQYLAREEVTVHSHGPEGEHEHGSTDFNTWLDPSLARQQARAICQALVVLLPEQQSVLESNGAALERDLSELEREFEEVFSELRRPLLASHPVYNYLARRYDLDLTSLHWEPEEMPEETQWRQLSDWLEEHRGALMIWEGTPSDAIAARLREEGVQFTVFHPCGNKPPRGDYVDTMKWNIAQIAAACGEAVPGVSAGPDSL